MKKNSLKSKQTKLKQNTKLISTKFILYICGIFISKRATFFTLNYNKNNVIVNIDPQIINFNKHI